MRSLILIVFFVTTYFSSKVGTQGLASAPKIQQPITIADKRDAPAEASMQTGSRLKDQGPENYALSQPDNWGQDPDYCYSCVDCQYVSPTNTSAKRCSLDEMENTRCVMYAEQYSDGKPTYVRGCVNERGTCEEIREVHRRHMSIKLLFCQECVGDRCNGVHRTIPNIIYAIVFMITTPLITKYTFS